MQFCDGCSDSQLLRAGASLSRRVKVTRCKSTDDGLRVHWISQDWGVYDEARHSVALVCPRRQRSHDRTPRADDEGSIGGVARWSGRRSLAGRLSLIYV